jgi:hypothetical protein
MPAPFADMFGLPFDYKVNVSQKIQCEWSQFGGDNSDPYPDVAKQCFCDSSNRKELAEVASQYDYLHGMIEIQRL